MSVDWVSPAKFAEEIGKTTGAVKTAAYKKRWPENLVWRKVGNSLFFSKSGWDKWLEMGAVLDEQLIIQYKLNSSFKGSAVESALKPSPRMPTFQ
jgi:hypothetical protein